MSALQIAVIEFWSKEGQPFPKWVRHPEWERPLADADVIGEDAPQPIWRRIANSERDGAWETARRSGDFSTMVAILAEFGCERPKEVAHSLDVERRRKLRLREWMVEDETLREARFGEEEITD